MKLNNNINIMETANKPISKIIWNGKNVTGDLQPFLSSVTYTDNEEGAADDIAIVLDNGNGLWSGDWYPSEGDVLELYLGYNDKLMNCGLFQVDELTFTGKPDIIIIKAIASFITKTLRTKNSKVFEEQTLRQIALYFCDKHGLNLIDDTTVTITSTSGGNSYSSQGKSLLFFAGNLNRVIKSNRSGARSYIDSIKSDLFAIARDIKNDFPNYYPAIVNYLAGIDTHDRVTLSDSYYMLLVRQYASMINKIGNALLGKSTKILTGTTTESMLGQIYLDRKTQEEKTDLQFLSELATEFGFVFSVKGNDLIFTSFYKLDNADAIKDISIFQIGNYSITEKSYDTYSSANLVKRTAKKNTVANEYETFDGVSVKEDILLVSGSGGNKKTLEAKIKAGLWNKNRFKQSGSLNDLPGDPYLVAGMNFNLIGLNLLSGKYHITKSNHTITGDGAYITSVDIRKCGDILAPRRVPPTKVEKEPYDENETDADENNLDDIPIDENPDSIPDQPMSIGSIFGL